MKKNVKDAMDQEETNMANMNDFLPIHLYAYLMLLNASGSIERYLNNLDSDTRAYVMRNLDNSCTISDIEECIRELKG